MFVTAPQAIIVEEAEALSDEQPDAEAPKSGHGAADPLDEFIRQVVSECGADGALVIWHEDGAQPRTVRFVDAPDGLDASRTVLREQSIAKLADGRGAQGGPTEVHSHLGTTYISAMIRLDGGVVSLSMLKSSGHAEETLACRSVLDRRLPLIKSFFAQWVAIQGLMAWESVLTAAIDHNDMPTLLLGRGGAIRYRNNAAQSLLAGDDILHEQAERLCCASLSDTLRLQSVIDHVLEDKNPDCAESPVLVLERDRRRPLLVAVTAANRNGDRLLGEDAAVVYVFDPEQDLAHMAEPACKLYGLSPCEARLACALVEGLSLADAAKKLHVREQTARSYLKQVFLKTDTNRQAELVQLLLKSSIRMAASDQPQFLL